MLTDGYRSGGVHGYALAMNSKYRTLAASRTFKGSTFFTSVRQSDYKTILYVPYHPIP